MDEQCNRDNSHLRDVSEQFFIVGYQKAGNKRYMARLKIGNIAYQLGRSPLECMCSPRGLQQRAAGQAR